MHAQPQFDPEASLAGGADLGPLDLEAILDTSAIQALLEDFQKLTGSVVAILDLKGRILVAVGWQDLCTRFHRCHPSTAGNCTESDIYLTGKVQRGTYATYKCGNGLWDVVTPLFIAGQHLGNIYTGQFLYEDEEVDQAAFEARAEACGFDRPAYLEALARVPRFSHGQIHSLMGFLIKLTDLISAISLSQLRARRFIAEQERAALALRESRALLGQILDTIPQLVFWKGLDGTFMGCNRPFAAAMGLAEPAEIVGKTDFDLHFPEAEALAYRACDRDVLASRQPQPHIIEPLVKADGTRLLIDTAKAPLLDRNGEPFALVGICQDITERTRAEAERQLLHAQLLQSQKMESLGSLAGGVAHDMNNVLGAVLALASANLETQPVGSPARLAFATIIKAAERGGDMVKGLLTFARQTSAEERPLDINDLLCEVLGLLQHTTLAKVRIRRDFAAELRPIRGDASALTHAFMNLCVNAVEAMPENGNLVLLTRNAEPDGIEVRVEDDGVGMTREVLERALDPFFTTKPQGKGTGLGLSMAYSVVTAHHGRITLLSAPEQGTRVCLWFPGCAPGPGAASAEPPAAAPARVARRVLLVDDDDLIQTSIGMLLDTLGHRVTGALSGEQALELLLAGLQPDLVILDMNMPGLGGAGTLPRLRELRPVLPVLLATGRMDQVALDLARQHAFTTLLSKPFSLEELRLRIEQCLEPA